MSTPESNVPSRKRVEGPEARRLDEWEEVGRKCRRVSEDIKRDRPRTKFVELKDIPTRLRRQRRMDVRLNRRTKRNVSTRRRKGEFSKSLQNARPPVQSLAAAESYCLMRTVRRWIAVSRESDAETEASLHDEASAGEESDGTSDSEEEGIDRCLDDADDVAYRSRRNALPDATTSSQECETLDEGYYVNKDVYNKLFDYQKRGVQWMWELHRQKAGGIIGDEMGLGKTAQVLTFLGGLCMSEKYSASLVLCPVTLLRHWLDEARQWAAHLRACVLHDSIRRSSGRGGMKKVIDTVRKSDSGLLITTYEHLRIYANELLPIEWGYVVLDEGHKIKNPDAEITLLVKQLRTRHRIIMTGSPVQNKLTELWSLFDFIFPGKLGTLPVFETEFGIPIQVGGYKNASRLSVSKAMKCASILRDIILPYMLIRRKSQVDVHLPNKQEHVLFCTLSEEQKGLYKAFIQSPEVESILNGRQHVLSGIDVLRKICNHPDLLQSTEECQNYGETDRSGKLKVTLEVLKLWKEQGDKALVFTQTQMMLDILEFHLQKEGYMYYRMDGCTSVRHRDQYIKSFNSDATVFAFLLTTKVGGLGVNLTGANRVLLYDPDWNPSVDVQARERAWRIGQEREVTIYRLITSGTIEEKIYQRQMFKQLLTDKVLKHVSQKRLFSSKRIRDLFTMDDKNSSETEMLLQGSTFQKGDSILEQLLEQGGVKIALDQKAVEDSHAKEGRDPISYQATVEAEEALDRMQTAEVQRSRFDVHFPTWTGRNGAAGAPPTMSRALEFGLRVADPQAPGICALEAPSSSQVLKKLQMRRSMAEPESQVPICERAPVHESLLSKSLPLANPAVSQHSQQQHEMKKERDVDMEPLKGVTEEEQKEWRQLVVEFFIQRGRVVQSDQLNTLAKRIPQEKRLAFRSVVQQLAEKIPGARRWVLHPDV